MECTSQHQKKTNNFSGENNSNWKGGRNMSPYGYIYLYSPDHPYRNKDKNVAEHRLVVEKTIGRYLKPTESVHHWDENVGNNETANLLVCENNSYHMLIHQRMRAYKATGNPNARFCRWCKQYDDDSNLYINGKLSYHRSCNAKNQMAYKLKRRQIQTNRRMG